MRVSLNVVVLLLKFDKFTTNETKHKIPDFTIRGRRLLNREQNRVRVC
jgi:hypothetical protein